GRARDRLPGALRRRRVRGGAAADRRERRAADGGAASAGHRGARVPAGRGHRRPPLGFRRHRHVSGRGAVERGADPSRRRAHVQEQGSAQGRPGVKRLLLLSNSTNFGQGYLEHAAAEIRALFFGAPRIAFVPFALHDQDAYTRKARARFQELGIAVDQVSADARGRELVSGAAGVFVGGGNTFRLLDRLQRAELVEPLRRRALSGMPYLGASAGSNIAAPTIKTTNDMPIVQPPSFEALGLLGFQLNPHYLDADAGSRHMGETREDRLREYLEDNETP